MQTAPVLDVYRLQEVVLLPLEATSPSRCGFAAISMTKSLILLLPEDACWAKAIRQVARTVKSCQERNVLQIMFIVGGSYTRTT